MKQITTATGFILWAAFLGLTCLVLVLMFTRIYTQGYPQVLESIEQSENYLAQLPLH